MKQTAFIIACYIFSLSIHAQVYWPNDLQYFKTELPQKHKNLFFNISQKEFNSRIDQLIKESTELSDIAIGIRLQQLFADIGDPHSNISLSKFIDKEKDIPIRAYWFDDGAHITKTSESHKKIIGSKILKINGHPLERIIDSLATMLVQDNPSINRAYLIRNIGTTDILEYFDFVDTGKEIIYELENEQGIYEERFMIGKKEKLNISLPIKKHGIGYQDQHTFFWDKYIPEDSIYYVQYNKCKSRESEKKYGDKKKAKIYPSFKKFKKKIFATIQEKPINKFIFDMRHNGGGSSYMVTKFVKKLKKYTKINKRGKLFVIIGRRTFSSAIINTMNFKRDTEAIIIGEETAGSPDHYGEVRSFKLPSSKVSVRYSTRYFNFTGKNLKSIKPDIAVPVYYSDLIKGKDAVFETAKNFK